MRKRVQSCRAQSVREPTLEPRWRLRKARGARQAAGHLCLGKLHLVIGSAHEQQLTSTWRSETTFRDSLLLGCSSQGANTTNKNEMKGILSSVPCA